MGAWVSRILHADDQRRPRRLGGGMDRARPRRRSYAPWLGALLLTAVLAATLSLWQRLERPPAIARRELLLGRVTRQDVVRRVSGPGLLVPVDVRWLSANHRARVQRLAVRPGDHVEPDTVVAELQNPELELALLEAERELSTARLQLAEARRRGNEQQSQLAAERATQLERSRLARAQRERLEQLQAVGAASVETLEQAQSQERELAERLTSLAQQTDAAKRARLAELKPGQQLVHSLEQIVSFRQRQGAELTLRAGWSGTIHSLSVEPGQWLEAGVLMAKLIVSPELEAQLSIDEVLAAQVSVGQQATITAGSERVSGWVSEIAPAASAGGVRVNVRWSGASPGLRPDQRVSGDIEVQNVPGATSLTAPAHVTRAGEFTLFKLARTDLLIRTQARLVPAADNRVLVESGLEEGDTVVISDMGRFMDVEQLSLE